MTQQRVKVLNMKKISYRTVLGALIGCAISMSVATSALAEDAVKVDIFNFVRAESDGQMKGYAEQGALGKFIHNRDPYPVELDKQVTIRGNRDTLYSFAVFDLTQPVTITKPESPDRFQSILAVNQDHSIPDPVMEPGEYLITQEKAGTRYVWVVIRTYADMNDPEDLKKAHALQDQVIVQQAESGVLELPNWDQKGRETVRDLINQLGNISITDFRGYFGRVEKLDPIRHLLGAAYGWGGNPENGAMYWGVTPEQNDGKTPYVLDVEDVPINYQGFWSVSVYNKDGFFETNDHNAYSFSNITAEPNDDGSFTIHFGGDPSAKNFLPIQQGWNYTARVYEPKRAVVDGDWTFPAPAVAQN